MATGDNTETSLIQHLRKYFKHDKTGMSSADPPRRIGVGEAEKQQKIVESFLTSCGADSIFRRPEHLGSRTLPFSETIGLLILEMLILRDREGSALDFPMLSHDISAELSGELRKYAYVSLGCFLAAYSSLILGPLPNFDKIQPYTKSLIDTEARKIFSSTFQYYANEVRRSLLAYGATAYVKGPGAGIEEQQKAIALFNEYEEFLGAHSKSLVTAIERAEAAETKANAIASEATARLETWETRYQAMEEAARKHLEIKLLDDLWDEKKREHERAFLWASGGLIALTATIAFSIVYWWEPYSGYVLKLAGPSPLAAGAVISIPAVVFFVFLRLLSRVATTSMLLRDDARQRRALAATLKSTIAEPGISLQSDLQRAAFDALFRVAPGQPPDENLHPIVDAIKGIGR